MKEVTVIIDAEMTLIFREENEKVGAPFDEEDRRNLAKSLKKQLGAADVMVKDAQLFVRNLPEDSESK